MTKCRGLALRDKKQMKSQLNTRRTIRFEKELDQNTMQASKVVAPDASDSLKSRQFFKRVRRLCRESYLEAEPRIWIQLLSS